MGKIGIGEINMRKILAAFLSLFLTMLSLLSNNAIPIKPGDTQTTTNPVVTEEPTTEEPVTEEPTTEKPTGEYEIETFGELSYGKKSRNTYGICYPKNMKGENGVILFIHGGSWTSGDKSTYYEEAIYWAKKGYAAAALNYRYLSDSKLNKVDYQDILSDIRDCVTAIYNFGLTKGIQFTKLMLTGASAGGHLALMYAYSGYGMVSTIMPICVFSVCAPTNLYTTEILGNPYLGSAELFGMLAGVNPNDANAYRQALTQASPVTWVSEFSVPTVILHGKKDIIVDYSQAVTLADKLKEKGVKYELITFPNSGHTLLENPEMSDDPAVSRYAISVFENYAKTYLK